MIPLALALTFRIPDSGFRNLGFENESSIHNQSDIRNPQSEIASAQRDEPLLWVDELP
jgi:hypothetical protein